MNPQKQRDIDNLIQQGYRLDIGGSIQQGWQILSQNLGGFIGFTLLTFLLVIASVCLLFVPLFFSGNLFAGYYIVSMRILKRQPVTFNNFFDGFRNSNFVPILLATLVIGAITAVVNAPTYAIRIFSSINPEVINNPTFLLIFGLLFLVSFCAGIYVGTIYVFTIPLILEHRLEFWPAMELSRKILSKQWFAFFGLVMLLSLINIGGALLCGLGLLVTSPLWFSSIAAAYNQVVGVDE